MILSAYLGSLQIHDTDNYFLTRFDLGTPEPRSVEAPRPHRHGTHDVTAYYGARTIAIAGEVMADSAATLWEKVDDLKAALALGSLTTLFFTRDGTGFTERAAVRAGSTIGISVVSGAALYLPWSVTLVAPDPRFYGDGHANAAVAPTVADTAENDGTVPTDPYITITGPINAGATIDNNDSGEALTIAKAISSGQSVIFDFYARTATHSVDGLDMGYVDSSATTWFSVAPGGQDLELNGSGTSGATQMEIVTVDARI